MALFTAEDKQRIEASIHAAERTTAAEIVVATNARSDRYLEARFLAAFAVALAGSSGVAFFFPWLSPQEVLILVLSLALVTFALSGVAPVLRAIVPEAIKEAAVERAAQLAFLKHSVFATQARTGVLILLSELEHKVVMLGDEGIHARVQEPGWDRHVASIVRAIHAGRAADGVCQVVEELAKLLAEGAPAHPEDINELPNRVRDDI